MTRLSQQHCLTPAKGLVALGTEEQRHYLAQVSGWQLADTGELRREFRFKDYYHTLAFVNAVAWIAHQQDHHPEMVVGYNRCQVSFTTHAVDGLSINDFISAAHINQLETADS